MILLKLGSALILKLGYQMYRGAVIRDAVSSELKEAGMLLHRVSDLAREWVGTIWGPSLIQYGDTT